MNGWIALHRCILDTPLWTKHKFTVGQAWIDLLLYAAHNDHKIMRDYGLMVIHRGQVLTSQLELAKRWKWHRETVSKFLRFLKADNMADIETSKSTSTGYTLITITNYGKYQDINEVVTDIDNGEETSIGTSIRAASERHPSGTINKGNKGNKNLPESFMRFWAAYPKKRNQPDALRAFLKINPQNGVLEYMLSALEIQKRQADWIKDSGQYIPYPGTWLNGRMWEDDLSLPITSHTGSLPVAPSMLERKRRGGIVEQTESEVPF